MRVGAGVRRSGAPGRPQVEGEKPVSKNEDIKKEPKKKPTKTLKEKRAEKKAKKSNKTS